MNARPSTNVSSLLLLRASLLAASLGAQACVRTQAPSPAPELPPPVEHDEPSPRATVVSRPPLPASDVADTCRGSRIVIDAEMSACACHGRDIRVLPGGPEVERAGEACPGRPSIHDPLPKVTVTLEKAQVGTTENAKVIVVFENADTETRVYRAQSRWTTARFVQKNGSILPRASLASGPSADEAMFELPPGGTATMVVEAQHSPAVWLDTRTSARRPLEPGKYAVEVALGSLGGTKLLPIEVTRQK